MAKPARWREIPTELSLERFEEFILPHLTVGRRGPMPKLPLHALFNYILKLLYLGCQWKELPIEKDATGRREIHHIRIWRTFRRWVADGCFNAIFEGTVLTLHQAELLDISIIHGDGTTTAAKKGGDNIGFNGHKKIKGDKVVAFCDRNCNVIAPFISAPGNLNESPLLRDALPEVTRIAGSIGLDLRGSIVSLDGVYDCQRNRKAIFIAAWCRTSTRIPETGNPPSAAASHFSTQRSSKNGSTPLSVCLPGRTNSATCCSGSNASASCITPSSHWPMR
jgi:transposase